MKSLVTVLNELQTPNDSIQGVYAEIKELLQLDSVNAVTELDTESERKVREFLTKPSAPAIANRLPLPAAMGVSQRTSVELTEGDLLQAAYSEESSIDRMGRARDLIVKWANELIEGKGYPLDVSPNVEKAVHSLAVKIMNYNAHTSSLHGYTSAHVDIPAGYIQMLAEPLSPETVDLDEYRKVLTQQYGRHTKAPQSLKSADA